MQFSRRLSSHRLRDDKYPKYIDLSIEKGKIFMFDVFVCMIHINNKKEQEYVGTIIIYS